jgi:hypothetical protein
MTELEYSCELALQIALDEDDDKLLAMSRLVTARRRAIAHRRLAYHNFVSPKL